MSLQNRVVWAKRKECLTKSDKEITKSSEDRYVYLNVYLNPDMDMKRSRSYLSASCPL